MGMVKLQMTEEDGTGKVWYLDDEDGDTLAMLEEDLGLPNENIKTLSVDEGQQRWEELLKHLDHTRYGDKHIAWYGQLRAKEMTHAEALEATVEHFHLRETVWCKMRGIT